MPRIMFGIMFRMNSTPRAQDAQERCVSVLHVVHRREAHDCRDAGGRATQEQLPRSGVCQVCTAYVPIYTLAVSSS